MARTPAYQNPTRVDTGCSDYGFSCTNKYNPVHYPWTCGGFGQTVCYPHQFNNGCRADAHQPSNSGCYGYSSSSTSLYNCPGHRDAGHYTSNITPPDMHPQLSSVIYASYLSALHEALNKEIGDPTDSNQSRRHHAMYRNVLTKDNTVVNSGDVLRSNSPNLLENSVEALRQKIASYEDYNSNRTISSIYTSISRSTIAEHSQLKALFDEINYKWKDCVCHADCTAFGSIWSRSCTCNSNCGCDYG